MDDARPTGSTSSYRSGAIEIDAMQRSVLIDGTPAKIGARAFDVLLALVERRDRVVPKHELMDLVWPRLVVEENNLLVHMVALRKLLGPRAIATIPGRGYRFALPVDAANGGSLAESAPPSIAPRQPPGVATALRSRAGPGRRGCTAARIHGRIDRRRRRHRQDALGVGGCGVRPVRIAGRTLVGRACADQRGHAGPEQHCGSARDAVTCRSAAAGSACHGARESESCCSSSTTASTLRMTSLSLVDLLRARAPNVRLLVTSQESLKCRDEQVYRLGALAVPASAQLEDAAEFGAVALFVERAHAVDSRFPTGQRQRRSGSRHLPATGRHSARH